MKYRNFYGKDASVIALGCDSFGTTRDLYQSSEFIERYVFAGGNFFDTARVYGGEAGRSEKYLGAWLSSRPDRDRFIIGTKGGHPEFHSMHTGRLDRESLTFDFENSVENLGTYIDVYWLHRDDTSRPVGDILETLNGFIESGKARFIGVSNWKPWRIKEANEYAAAHSLTGFCANQPQFSLAQKHFSGDDTLEYMDHAAYEFHKMTGMPCVPYSPQAKGYFSKYEKGGAAALGERLRREFLSSENDAIHGRLTALSRESGYTASQLSLSYLLAQPFDVYPIIGASSFDQLDESLACADIDIDRKALLSLRDL